MRATAAIISLILIIVVSPAPTAQYPVQPDWESSSPQYSTGAAFGDIDKDGWPDLVIADGNDMSRQRVVVYYNDNGALPTTPSWQSDDRGYNGHISVGDINQDGWLDVAVALLLGEGGHGCKVYFNDGTGQLETSPGWQSANNYDAFQCELGDADLDGDLDLAVATGFPYGGSYYPTYVYFNDSGVLDTNPGWVSDDTRHYDDVGWADVDRDGDLDLVCVGSACGNYVYFSDEGSLQTTATWHSTDNNNQFGNTLALGDVTCDGLIDFIMSDNNQMLGGTGDFKQYTGVEDGAFTQTPTWEYYDGYVSGVTLADVNNDGMLDLATGAWWDHTRIFLNTGSGLPSSPSWNSARTSVVEAIVFGDVNKDGLQMVIEDKDLTGGLLVRSLGGDGQQEVPVQQKPDSIVPGPKRKLYYLDNWPAEKIDTVVVDGRILGIDEYCANPAVGWLSLAEEPKWQLRMVYTYSTKLDMAVSNWDPAEAGNFLYYHE